MNFDERYRKHRELIERIDSKIEKRKKLTKKEGLELLKEILEFQNFLQENGKSSDYECDHATADEILLKIIGDKDVKETFDSIMKWYA